MATNAEARKPSEKDAAFFYHVLVNLRETKLPDVDWDKVAAASGLKNARVAKVRYQQIIQKLATPGELPATPKRATPKKRKTPSKKGASAEMNDDNDDEDEVEESPTKKAKVKSEVMDDDDFGLSDA